MFAARAIAFGPAIATPARRLLMLLPALLATLLSPPSAGAAPLNRPRDPVVIQGAALSSLQGLAPKDVLAFRFDGSWTQIPVQIDERKYMDFGTVYDSTAVGAGTVTYVDSTTYTGPDTDPMFDSDDELVFMAKDAGPRAPGGSGAPGGTVPGGPAYEIEITDPLNSSTGYVYLFLGDGSLPQDAGANYVTYTFAPSAGSYIPNYDLYGPNPEDSEVYSSFYRTHFSEMWIRDEINVYAGSATSVDILDRHRSQFAPDVCVRSEDTFSEAEEAFFANIDGPVRAIRSYMGANSGPFTQRLHIFYERRQDVATFLRVHAIMGIMDVYDYSPAASGMTYYNNYNTAGVTIDGLPDSVAAGSLTWEMTAGAQGSLVISHSFDTDITPFTRTSYYSDDETPYETQCTGDAFEYGESGDWVDHDIPSTDPLAGSNYLNTTRIMYYEPPNQSAATALTLHNEATTPLVASVSTYQAGSRAPALSPRALALLAILAILAAGAGIARSRRGVTSHSQAP